ncbi:hypothetical protein BFS35_010775 [Macrococcoides goetzii]|uniref:ABC transporter substrate-binding protein n=1 Tax=Macrococcoides goetzii TaxID=1891097 RepID=A0A395G7I7_9STAP|nr:ABC transporter substrate-binding protein [Macrococcus goetzii]RAI79930.1 hypothetical protein BFS35_010775 [Macrococcus goetzii]
MDKRLLYVEKYLSLSEPSESLADYLQLSKRQLSRLLSQWQDEGYINYSPAIGRGGKMDITFNVDVEKELFYHALKTHKDMTIQEVKSYLDLPWDEESREVIVKQLKNNFATNGNNQNSIIDFVYNIPHDIHPLTAQSMVSFQVISQIMRTLYTIDQEYNIQYDLAKYDEWVGNTLHIYLHQDDFFPDRKRLTASIVCLALNKLIFYSKYKKFFSDVISVDLIDDFQISITLQEKNEHIKYLLSEPYSSIYFEEDNEVYGTGPYYLKSRKPKELILQANPYYKRLVQIEQLYFVENKKRFSEYISSDKYDTNKTQRFYLGHRILLMNPNTTLNFDERKQTIQTLQSYLYEYFLHNDKYFKWNGEIPDKKLSMDNIHRPVRLLIDEFNVKVFKDIVNEINKERKCIELIVIKHEDYIKHHLSEHDVDIVWMTEAIHQEQPFMLNNLLLHAKFKEWYLDKEPFQLFNKKFRFDNFEALETEAISHLKNLEDNYYYSNVLINEKVFIYTSAIQHIDINQYGFIDYGSVILK